MFQFNFNVEDIDDELSEAFTNITQQPEGKQPPVEPHTFSEIPLSLLLDRLPSLISHSPLSVPLPSGRSLTLARRDLFDARFQLISEGGEATSEVDSSTGVSTALDFIEAPSDLVPGVYEGGLKTWECSLDLIDYLDGALPKSDILGKKILEIGCGTAVPSLYLLHQLFSIPPQLDSDVEWSHIHLQDYNSSVLALVTLPNVLLTWYMSPCSAPYREAENQRTGLSSAPDPTLPSELPITTELKAAFISSLNERKISIRFFDGSWDTFNIPAAGGKYDIVLTSETIYRKDSLPSLISLMRLACKGIDQSPTPPPNNPYLCLVAAKVIYFGVGGGVSEFVNTIRELDNHGDLAQTRIETVWEQKLGVARRIMRVQWGS